MTTGDPGGGSGDEVIGVRHGMFGAKGTGDTSGYGRLIRQVSLPGGTAPPYGGYFDALVESLRSALDDVGLDFAAAVEKVVVFRDELTLHVRRADLVAVARALRDDPALRFELCLGVNGVHYPDDADRELHAVYHLTSITHGRRVRILAVPVILRGRCACRRQQPFGAVESREPLGRRTLEKPEEFAHST
ncbi:NADH-quinone oxidoreductase subunit C, partial [Nocardia cyriacigeorgica]|uniref:NADH-quinone oxidoreductase subunit C n=1 Tax=Nocardia cyriacigeorgica TaxID=135487 RepID=UPI002453833A